MSVYIEIRCDKCGLRAEDQPVKNSSSGIMIYRAAISRRGWRCENGRDICGGCVQNERRKSQ